MADADHLDHQAGVDDLLEDPVVADTDLRQDAGRPRRWAGASSGWWSLSLAWSDLAVSRS